MAETHAPASQPTDPARRDLPSYDAIIIGAGMSGLPVFITMALGVPLVIVARCTTKGDFFKTKMVAYKEID